MQNTAILVTLAISKNKCMQRGRFEGDVVLIFGIFSILNAGVFLMDNKSKSFSKS